MRKAHLDSLHATFDVILLNHLNIGQEFFVFLFFIQKLFIILSLLSYLMLKDKTQMSIFVII
jgi:hypothetical protein